MSETNLEGMPIANIVMAEVTNESTGETYYFDTADKADAKPDLSKGKEDILRVKNRIVAMNRTEDICIGYQVSLTDNTFPVEVMCLVDGGTMTAGGYEGPVVGNVVERTYYTLSLYCEQKDYDSSTTRYIKFTFKHNKGTPVEFKFEDGKFYVPDFNSVSRPKKGEKPVYITYVDSLPNGTAADGGFATTAGASVSASGDQPGINVGTDCKVTWTFNNAIDPASATSANFFVIDTSNSSHVAGNVTIDGTNKIVTFIPTAMVGSRTFTAESNAVPLLAGGGSTTAASVSFTTL